MRLALVISSLTLLFSICLLVAATFVFRLERIRTERKTLIYQDNLRKLLVKFLSEDLNPSELARLKKIRSADLDKLSDSLLSKVKGRAKDILVSFLESRGAVDEAIQRTRKPGCVGRCRAALFLGNIATTEAQRPLEYMLSDVRRDVRITAARSLGQLQRPESIPALLASAEDHHRDIPFGTLLLAVLRIGMPGIPGLQTGLHSQSEKTRALSVEALGLLRSLENTNELVNMLLSDPSLDVRIRCARALGRIGSNGGVDPLISTLSENQPTVLKLISCGSLAEIGDTAAIPHLMDLLCGSDNQVARRAAFAIARLGTPGVEALHTCISTSAPGSRYAIEVLTTVEIKGQEAFQRG